MKKSRHRLMSLVAVMAILLIAPNCGSDAVAPLEEEEEEEGLVGDDHPNEPAGMTVIGSNDGTVIEQDGVAFGIDGFGAWRRDPHIQVVNDAGNPTGSGKALEFTYDPETSGAGVTTLNSFPQGTFEQLYIMYRVVIQSGGWDFGRKLFYLGTPGQSQWGQGIWVAHEQGGKLRIIDGVNNEVMDSSDPAPKGNGTNALGQRDSELAVEFLFIAESAENAGDGEVHVWVNGTKVGESQSVFMNDENEGYTPTFSGMQWYNHANSVPTTSVYRLREFYIAGSN